MKDKGFSGVECFYKIIFERPSHQKKKVARQDFNSEDEVSLPLIATMRVVTKNRISDLVFFVILFLRIAVLVKTPNWVLEGFWGFL